MKTHIEICRGSLIHNIRVFHRLGRRKLMVVLKANAYGHGLAQVAGVVAPMAEVDYLAVDSLAEARELGAWRERKPVLVLGWSDEPELAELIAMNVEVVMPSLEQWRIAEKLAKKMQRRARVHVKVETGTARLGMEPDEVAALLKQPGWVEAVGLYSHFANIEDTSDSSFAFRQLQVFRDLVRRVNRRGLVRHFSCSASALLFPQTYFDMVRVGISAYGYWPSKQTYLSHLEKKTPDVSLLPALTWHSRVAQVKTLRKGSSVGYGLSYRALADSRIAVIPVGYYDGYDRRLSNTASVIIRGALAPVRGRVCMNMFMVEVTHIRGVRPGDDVVLLGSQGGERVDADQLAEWAGTINYEILARLNPAIPRRLVE